MTYKKNLTVNYKWYYVNLTVIVVIVISDALRAVLLAL